MNKMSPVTSIIKDEDEFAGKVLYHAGRSDPSAVLTLPS